MERLPEMSGGSAVDSAADGNEDNQAADAVTRRREQNRLAQRRFRWKQSQQKSAQRPKVGQRRSYRDSRPSEVHADAAPDQQLASPSTSSTHDVRLVSAAFSPAIHAHPVQGNLNTPACVSWEGLLADQTGLDLSGSAGCCPLSPSASDSQFRFGSEDLSLANDDRVENSTFIVMSPQVDLLAGVDIVQQWPSPRAIERRDSQHPSLSTSTPASSPRNGAGTTSKQPRPRPSPHTGPEEINQRGGGVPEPSRGWLGPLHLAAAKGHDRIVRVLLKRQSPDCQINGPDSDGMTALMHAIKAGFDDVAQSLLDAGAGVDQADNQGRTALHWAVLRRRETLLRQLLEHGVIMGADLNVYNNEGQTPLHSAIDGGFELGVQMLLEFGGDLKCRAQKF